MSTRPRVYLADPDSAFRLAVARALRDAGIDVVEFASPAQLEARALAEEPDLVLLANGRREMEGQQVLARLRSPIHPRSSPLVLVTDRTQPFDSLAASVASLLQDWNRLAVHTVSSIVTWLQTRGKSGRLEMEALGARSTVLLQDGEITHASWKELRDREVLAFFAEKFPNAGFRFAERIPTPRLQANGRAGTLDDRPARAPLPSPPSVKTRAVLESNARPAGRVAPAADRFQAEAHLELARKFLAGGGWAEAFVHLRLAESLSAPRERVQALLGVAHLRTGDLQAALQELCKALRVDPLDDVAGGALLEAVGALRALPTPETRPGGRPADGRASASRAAGGAREPGASRADGADRDAVRRETSGAGASPAPSPGPGAQIVAGPASGAALASVTGADPHRRDSPGVAVDPGATPSPGAVLDAGPLRPPVAAGPRVLTRALRRATTHPDESPAGSLVAAPSGRPVDEAAPEGSRRVARRLPPAAAPGPTPHHGAPRSAPAVRRQRNDAPPLGAKVAGHRGDPPAPAAALPSRRLDAPPPAARANDSSAAAASSPDGRGRPASAAPRYVPQFYPSGASVVASRRWSPARLAAGATAAAAMVAAMFVLTLDRRSGDATPTASRVASVGDVGVRAALAPVPGDAPSPARPLVDPSALGEGLTSAPVLRTPHASTPERGAPTEVPGPSLEELRSGPRRVPLTRTPAPNRVLDPRSIRALIEPSRELAIVREWAHPEDPRRPATLWVLVDASGRVRDARILTPSGDARFDEKALRAVRNVAYEPARRGDSAVPAWTRQRVTLRAD